MSRRVSIVASLVLSACTMQRVSPSMASGSSTGMDEHSAHMRAADLVAPSTSAHADRADQQGTPGLPASAQTAAARLAASPRHGEWVKIAWSPGSSDSLMAWIVYPKAGAKAPVVVVVHEIFGLSTWVRSVADQAAADGFIAIAPDFLSRVRGGPSSVELASDSARRMISEVDPAERNRAIIAAANYAMTRPAASPRYAVIGYCWGGSTTFIHAVNGGVKGFSGGVAFYGLPYMSGGSPATATASAVPASLDVDSLARIKQPIMLLSGSKDARIGAAMPALETEMKRLGKSYTGVNYEGAIHGFLRAQNDPKATRDEAEEAANYAATKDAWPRTIVFLRKQLGVK
ncbi:MAG: dienelactone hydrolase family protein [Gemmatimonadota bacterium]